MSSLVAKEIARACNALIGAPDAEQAKLQVSDLTLRLISECSMPDIFIFIAKARIFDHEMLTTHILKNGQDNEILAYATAVTCINASDLLIDYINYFSEPAEGVAPRSINDFVQYYIQFVTHLEYQQLADWALETNNFIVMTGLLYQYPLIMLGEHELFETLVHRVMAHPDITWGAYAGLFTIFPGLIAEYDEQYGIREKLAGNDEVAEEIKAFAHNLYHNYNGDTVYHLYVMDVIKSPILSQAMMDLGQAAFEEMVDGDMFGIPNVPNDEESPYSDEEEG